MLYVFWLLLFNYFNCNILEMYLFIIYYFSLLVTILSLCKFWDSNKHFQIKCLIKISQFYNIYNYIYIIPPPPAFSSLLKKMYLILAYNFLIYNFFPKIPKNY